jgi:hypothetical protein
MRHIRALSIFLTFILLSSTPFLHAATEQRIALVIGNGAYELGRLKNPTNDATDIAAALQKAGFAVILKKNARLKDMEDAIENFGNRLKRGGVGLFYFAGHGVQVNGINYLIPIGGKIHKESDIKYEAVDANRVLDEMANANNGLNIVMLDACRDNPYARSFRNAARGLAIVSTAPTGTFISYSTGPGQVAGDGDGRNSPYTAALIQSMRQPGLTIEQVFKSVRAKIGKQTGGKQVPWELSSLQGEFYFVPGKLSAPVAATPPSSEIVRDERRGDAVSTANEIKRDGRFIAYDNSAVLDTRTSLMWAARDNGLNIYWPDAKSYCENYRGGGYSDWRMPTQDELAELYDSSKSNNSYGLSLHLTELIHLSGVSVWGSETQGSKASYYSFYFGERGWNSQSVNNYNLRALPVRSGK